MEYFNISLVILVLIQIFKVEASEFNPSMIEYKETSDWRKHKTILEERIACIEICNECFSDEVIFKLTYS